jgi:3-deoxy-manno-octulosonate cytidylyltransferase (CMP-KDO synthetase)
MSSQKREAIGIIPARFGSTRFPGKPLSLISGKSLIRHVYEKAKSCHSLDEVVVATDDVRILKHVEDFGGLAVMTSVDAPSGTDRLAEAVLHSPLCQGFQIVVNVQGDEPLMDPLAIAKVVELLQNDPEAVAATTISIMTALEDAHNPSVVKCVKDQKDNALYFSRTLIPANRTGMVDPKVTYYRHMGLYGYRTAFLLEYGTLPATPLQLAEDLEQLKVLENGYRMKVAVIKSTSIEVNHPEDIQKVESFLWEQNTSS